MDAKVIYEMMDLAGLVPSADDVITFAFYFTLSMGFVFIVLGSEKYRHLFQYIEKYF